MQKKKAKWLSGEALQIAVKRREAKSKGRRKSYIHLNAEFQRIASRDKKAFLSDQCKEIEENISFNQPQVFTFPTWTLSLVFLCQLPTRWCLPWGRARCKEQRPGSGRLLFGDRRVQVPGSRKGPFKPGFLGQG